MYNNNYKGLSFCSWYELEQIKLSLMSLIKPEIPIDLALDYGIDNLVMSQLPGRLTQT